VQYVELTPSVAFDTASVALSAVVAFEDSRGKECVGMEIARAVGESITDVATVRCLEGVKLAKAFS